MCCAKKMLRAFVCLLCSSIMLKANDPEIIDFHDNIHIAVIDMQDLYDPKTRESSLATLYEAMSSVGFFAVRNTGVDAELIAHTYDKIQAFFKQDLSKKMEASAPGSRGQRGFVPGEKAKGSSKKDTKEFFHMGPFDNVWPKKQDGFKEAMQELFQELSKYALPLTEAIVDVMNHYTSSNLPNDFLHEKTCGGDTLLRAIYYPAVDQTDFKNNTLYWAAEHTDIDLLTILPYATERGLQVFKDGKWMTVVVPKDSFIINIGDMLQNLTNGLFKSSKHRVIALDPDKDRFSAVFFLHFRDLENIAPLESCINFTGGVQKYAPGTKWEFLMERLLELGLADEFLEAYAKTGHTERQKLFCRQSPQVVALLQKHALGS